jgi:hypothetical protein
MTSILTSTKKVLGLDESYTAFDADIIMHINTVFADLNQLGVGPSGGFAIENATAAWEDYLEGDSTLNQVKTYMYLRVRMVFDPPNTGYVLASFERQIKEHEWRLNVKADHPATTRTITLEGGTP